MSEKKNQAQAVIVIKLFYGTVAPFPIAGRGIDGVLPRCPVACRSVGARLCPHSPALTCGRAASPPSPPSGRLCVLCIVCHVLCASFIGLAPVPVGTVRFTVSSGPTPCGGAVGGPARQLGPERKSRPAPSGTRQRSPPREDTADVSRRWRGWHGQS